MNNSFEPMIQAFLKTLPKNLMGAKTEIAANLEQCLQAYFNRLNLVTREEFDLQIERMKRMKKSIAHLEEQLDIKKRRT